MSPTCIFCRIVSGDIPADVVYRDDAHVAFRDIHPQAPAHAVLVPARHHETLLDMTDATEQGALILAAAATARALGLVESGFRVVVNYGPDGGQEVPHVHYHILGGRLLGWPPG